MTDCEGRSLPLLTPEPPHDNAVFQCAFCGRVRFYENGVGQWTVATSALALTIAGFVICPRCHKCPT